MIRYHKWELWLLLICIQVATGFYHEPSAITFKNHDLPNDSYFGYSITYQANVKSLIVGAPKANVIGQVYTIDVDSQVITPVPTPNYLQKYVNKSVSKYQSAKTYLVGATVKAGSNFFVMCAPRCLDILRSEIVVNDKVIPTLTVLLMGLCVVKPTNGTMHLLDNDKPTANTKDRIMKPYGFSLDVTATDTVLVGAPASYSGSVKVVQMHNSQTVNSFTTLEPQNTNTSELSYGYAVASGNFLNSEKITSLSYVISMPFTRLGLGKVFINDSTSSNVITIDGFQLGSLFGAALCTVNLGDRQDSLLIGAPTFTDDVAQTFEVDRGAVYLYVLDVEKNEMVNIKTIEGQSDGAYFGNSIVNLGDIDGDMKDDVAIGAPYENNGRGAVYIYTGARLLDLGLQGNQMLIQRIEPEPNKGILSFGFSLTPLQDYDDNGCNELAVGAPDSNAVLLYRCFNYITINLQAIFPSNAQVPEIVQDTFIFKSCVNVQFPKKPENISEVIRVQVKIFHQDVWFSTGNNTTTNEMVYQVPLIKEQSTKNITKCKDITVTKREMGDFELLMSYTISASLMDDPHNSSVFDGNRVLSKQSTLSLVGQESLADCQGQCEPSLEIEFKPNDEMSNLYIVGSTTEGTFSFVVHNAGDPAYTACLLVQIKGAPLLRPPQGCTTETGEDLICTPTILLRKGIDWTLGDITLDTSGLTSKHEKITVSYELYNHCNNRTKPKLGKETFILYSMFHGITLLGESDPGNVVDIFSESSRVQHVYTITNPGPTTWEEVTADIVATKIENVKYENIIVETEDERQVSCHTAEETKDELKANCPSLYLKRGKKLKVILPFVCSPAADGAVKTQNVSSTVSLHLKKDVIKSNVTTELQFKKSTVPLWIIVTAALAGLVLLTLLGYALFSCGFLKRQKRESLEELKRNVYRQSVHRESMRQSKRDVEEKKLVESTNTIQEEESPVIL